MTKKNSQPPSLSRPGSPGNPPANPHAEPLSLADTALRIIRLRGPLILTLLFLLLSLGIFVVREFWYDEVLTISLLGIRRTPAALYFSYEIPNNHILFSIILQFFRNLLELLTGANSGVILRLPSLLFGLASILLFQRILRTRTNRAASFVCSLALVVSCTFLLFATAVRGYMTGFFLILCAFLAAERIFRNQSPGAWMLFGGLAILAVGVTPSNLAGLCAIPFVLPLFRPDALRQWKKSLGLFAVSGAALIAFYLPNLTQFLEAANLREGWHGRAAALGNLYGTFLIAALPILPFACWGLLASFRGSPARRVQTFLSLIPFLFPAAAALSLKNIIFPRIFFPLWGIWFLCLGVLAAPSFRARNGKYTVPVSLAVLLWGALVIHSAPRISDTLFGDGTRDDMLSPHYARIEFSPYEVARHLLKRRSETAQLRVYVTFDADPPAQMYAFSNLEETCAPETFVLFDRPNASEITRDELANAAPLLIVARELSDMENAAMRFGRPHDPSRVLWIGSFCIAEFPGPE